MTAVASSPHFVLGAVLMIGAALCFALMSSVVRLMGALDLHPFEIAFFRSFFGLVALLPWVVHGRSRRSWKTSRLKLYLLRAVLGSSAMLCFFWGLTVLPLAEAVTLSFTAPLFVTALAPVFLNEVVGIRRWSATLFGFVGMLLVMRPGFESVPLISWVVLFSAALMGCSVLVIKRLASTEPADRIVFYMALMMTPITGVAAIPVWQWPSAQGWGLALLLGILGTLGHLLFTQSMRKAEITAVMPFDFIRLPAVAFLGWALFGQAVDVWVWIGGGVIFFSGLYILHRERLASRLPQARDRVV